MITDMYGCLRNCARRHAASPFLPTFSVFSVILRFTPCFHVGISDGAPRSRQRQSKRGVDEGSSAMPRRIASTGFVEIEVPDK